MSWQCQDQAYRGGFRGHRWALGTLGPSSVVRGTISRSFGGGLSGEI